jgi:hypothetical protein
LDDGNVGIAGLLDSFQQVLYATAYISKLLVEERYLR